MRGQLVISIAPAMLQSPEGPEGSKGSCLAVNRVHMLCDILDDDAQDDGDDAEDNSNNDDDGAAGDKGSGEEALAHPQALLPPSHIRAREAQCRTH